MGRISGRGGSYGHKIRMISGDTYRIIWTTDKHYEGSRIRYPRGHVRETDEKGARRFAKRWGIAMPRKVYTPVLENGWRLGIAVEGSPGYFPVREDSDAGGTFPNRKAAQGVADAYNEKLGFTPQQAAAVVATTLAP